MIHLGHSGGVCPVPNIVADHVSESDADDESDEEGGEENWEDDDDFALKDIPERKDHCRRPPPSAEGAPADVDMDSADAAVVADVEMVIVDRSGVHRMGVRWCRCPNAEARDIQLLDCGLFPASFDNIKTAFTFHVLDDFLMTNLECKTSCMNFYNKLRRVTSSAFPFVVPVSRVLVFWVSWKGTSNRWYSGPI